ncbi:MAG: OadG family protein [Candidatus Thermoplasmatota archaeon]|nr:OadG family protein [Candidatus Thermoplasmatota archaeon]
MNPLEVILIGIGMVFLTLSILTLATYFFGWLIDKYFVKEEKDDKEKIAAVVAAVRSRGGK